MYYIATSPYVRTIPAELQDPFEEDCLEKMMKDFNIMEISDEYKISYNLLYVVARKPGQPQKAKTHKHKKMRDRIFSLPDMKLWSILSKMAFDKDSGMDYAILINHFYFITFEMQGFLVIKVLLMNHKNFTTSLVCKIETSATTRKLRVCRKLESQQTIFTIEMNSLLFGASFMCKLLKDPDFRPWFSKPYQEKEHFIAELGSR